jgi:hypothetical protein
MTPIGPGISPVSSPGGSPKDVEKTLFSLPQTLQESKHATNTPAVEWIEKQIVGEVPAKSKIRENIEAVYLLLVTNAIKSK